MHGGIGNTNKFTGDKVRKKTLKTGQINDWIQ